MKSLARKNIRDIRPYEPGKPIKELARELHIGERRIIKLASNENPLGPSPRAVKALRGAIGGVNRYPDGSGFYLKKRLAANLGIREQNLILGNGSDEIIDIITKAFLEEDEEAVISEPSFLEYKILIKARGAKIRAVSMNVPSARGHENAPRFFAYDIDKVLMAVNKRTKLIFFGNPDNPTGAYITKVQLKSLLKRCAKSIILVFDEAYREFIQRPDYPDMKDYINRYNIVVLRTFSKAYGLAGLRIGYGIADKRLIGWMERVRQPFNVNMLAQAAAEAALGDTAHIFRTKRLITSGKRFLTGSLEALGFEVIEGPANFILISYKGINGTDIFKRLLRYGVIIRDMKAYGLPAWARVNVGTMPENKRFVDAVRRIL